MKIIDVAVVNDVLCPSEPIPNTAILVLCNGKTYTVYEEGDELPVGE
jgi:uncharacterized protein YlzI (FlbEa/FlbD family)